MGKTKGNWAEELPAVLWSYKTRPRTGTQEAPFSLAYGAEAMLAVEMTTGALRRIHAEEETNSQDLRLSLDLLEE